MDRYLIMLFGNIASGKTTISKKLDKAGCVIVSSDAIRYMFHPNEYKFDATEEFAVHATEETAVKTLIDLNKNIVVDDAGNCLKGRRKWIVDMAKQNCYKLIALTMPFTSKQVAVRRRLKSNHGKYDKARWEEVYDMFQKNYCPPTKKEGFDELLYSNSRRIFDLLKVN